MTQNRKPLKIQNQYQFPARRLTDNVIQRSVSKRTRQGHKASQHSGMKFAILLTYE